MVPLGRTERMWPPAVGCFWDFSFVLLSFADGFLDVVVI